MEFRRPRRTTRRRSGFNSALGSMKTTYLLLLNLILPLTFRTAQAGDNRSAVRQGRLSFNEVTSVVLANNPSIKAAQEKWRAMKARVPQAAAWEDLRVQARSRVARYVSIPPNAFTDQSFMLQQEVPISGKNLSRARAATAEAADWNAQLSYDGPHGHGETTITLGVK
jgi:outer membrane protein TolC